MTTEAAQIIQKAKDVGECQCSAEQTTGWTDDDMCCPRCNVCGLKNMDEMSMREAVDRLIAPIFED